MKRTHRNLLLALALGAFTFTATSGFASMVPSMQSHPNMGQHSTHAQMNRKSRPRTQSVSGTIIKSGQQYELEASTGQTYQLSNASRAKAYVGKTVTVTGKVNKSSHVIDVQSIQPQ